MCASVNIDQPVQRAPFTFLFSPSVRNFFKLSASWSRARSTPSCSCNPVRAWAAFQALSRNFSKAISCGRRYQWPRSLSVHYLIMARRVLLYADEENSYLHGVLCKSSLLYHDILYNYWEKARPCGRNTKMSFSAFSLHSLFASARYLLSPFEITSPIIGAEILFSKEPLYKSF